MGEDYMKYGHVRGGRIKASPGLVWAASQVVKARSGRFVLNTAGAITLCGDGSDTIFGWAEESEGTPVAASKVGVIVDPSAIYRIPVDGGTFAIAMVDKTCDLGVTSNIQGADLAASVDDVLIIVGGDLVNNEWVDVMINPKERNAVGV